MSNALLNVVIIAKMNTSLRFLRTLESVMAQVYTPIRVVVVDANEQDSMHSLGLQEDVSIYPEVDYLKINQAFSMAEIRNYLLSKLDGEYIAFLNDNDSWDQAMALSQIKKLKEDDTAAASCVNGSLVDERKPSTPIEPLMEKVNKDPSKWVLYNPVKMSAQIIYKSRAVKGVGGFDEQFSCLCDADMVLRLAKKNKVLITKESLCECRLTSTYNNYELSLFFEYKRLRMKYLNTFIVNRKLSQEFYGEMIPLAKLNYMWIDLFIYMIMYFIKGPFGTIKFLIRKLAWLIYNGFRRIHRDLSIINEKFRIAFNVFIISMGKQPKRKVDKYINALKKQEKKQVRFSSAKHYNEQGSLRYVFNKNISRVVIPDHVTIIKKGMFYACTRLEIIEIPNTVVEIEDHAFHRCSRLRKIRFQKKSRLNKIGDYAFAGCVSLEAIDLPSSVSQIGTYAFAECYSLRKLMFDHSSLYPASIEKIAPYAFAACESLKAVEFCNNSILERVEKGAFIGCRNLSKLVFTSRLKVLGPYSLAYCKELETAAFLQIDSLRSIGKCAFMHCENMPYFKLPNELERIRTRTFYGCSRLKFIKIPKKVLSINHQAFANCDLLSSAVIQSGDIVISQTAFDKHTKIELQEALKTDKM